MPVFAALLLLLLALIASPARAEDVHRCTGADGNTIFTDKKCEDIGAQVRQAPAPQEAGSTGHLGVRGCARTLESLQSGLKAALYSDDVNHLAAFYHWPGISSAESVGILNRLQSIVERPLTAVNLIGARPALDAGGYRIVASERSVLRANGIEIVQAQSANDPTELRTQFTLTQNAGCWWVQF